MGSTGLMTYLNYISVWSSESDENIQCLISEFNAFVKLHDMNPDPVIDTEFTKLVNLAKTVRDETVAADAIQLAADAAGVAAMWSLGIGMAAFMALEMADAVMKAVISDKSGEFNKQLEDLDSTLASKMGSNFNTYITKYKANNAMIAAQVPAGLDKRRCRSLLMQFMARVQRKVASFDVATFRKYAEVARRMFNSEQINDVYQALDNYVLGNKNKDENKALMKATKKFLGDLKLPKDCYFLVGGEVLSTMLSAKISPEIIQNAAKKVGYPMEEIDDAAIDVSDAIEDFTGSMAVGIAIVSAVLVILSIVNVVEEYDEWIATLEGPTKQRYKDYYNGIFTSSQKYRKVTGRY